jgi:serine protease Do
MLRLTSIRDFLLIGGVALLLGGAVASAIFSKRAVAVLPVRSAGGLSEVITRVLPGVVNIAAQTGLGWATRPATPWLCGPMTLAKADDTPVMRDGTGFVIDPAGFILTNRHVVEGADTITVTLQDNTVLNATVIGVSPCDLALLKVDAGQPLTALKFADSDDIRVGEPVVAVGNALGLGTSVSVGIISALHRNIGLGPFDDFIQTDAPINHGNSGGPLLNTKGEVIGVNSVTLNSTSGSIGLGFAFPSNDAKICADQLRKDGRVHPGWLGLMVQQVTPELAEALGLKKASGALITAVSPTWRDVFQAGDVVMALDGKRVQGDRVFIHDVALTPVGRKATVEIWRDGSEHNVPVTIAEWNEKQAAMRADPSTANPTPRMQVRDFGLRFEDLNDALRSTYNIDPASNGVLVADIQPGSTGAQSELERGDLIVEVQPDLVATIDEVRARFDDLLKHDHRYALILFRRQNAPHWAALRLFSGPP